REQTDLTSLIAAITQPCHPHAIRRNVPGNQLEITVAILDGCDDSATPQEGDGDQADLASLIAAVAPSHHGLAVRRDAPGDELEIAVAILDGRDDDVGS